MTLNELQYLLLSELANTGLLHSQPPGSVMEIVRSLQPVLESRKQGNLAAAILGSAHFADLDIQGNSDDGRGSDWVIYLNKPQGQAVIAVVEPREAEPGSTYAYQLDEAVHKLRDELSSVATSVFTGLGYGGWRAALLAEALHSEAVVFGAPSVEELPGKAVNYVGEDDPVGDHLEKVVFVKQAEGAGDEEETHLSSKLSFDENGKAVVSGQSEFSSFVSWFYNTVGSVEPEVWNIFFPGSEEEESTILADLGIYSVFLKVGELNKEKILRSIDETVRFTAGRLEANRNQLAAELDKLQDEEYDELVSGTAEKYTRKASEFVVRIFESVQTVLMGVALFTLEQESFDMDTPIDSFHVQIHDLLDQEFERVKECLDQAIARRLEKFLEIPQFNFEW